MPIPNVIAGILIGWNNDWPGVFLVPFVWGLVWWLGLWVIGRPDRYKAAWNPAPHWKLGARTTFFLQEYTTAVFTSLPFSILTASVKAIF